MEALLKILAVNALLSIPIGSAIYCLTANGQSDHQARVWHATRYPAHWQSKTPWQTVIVEPTYDAAVKTAAERMAWPRDTFSVTPVTSDYVDQREIRYTP